MVLLLEMINIYREKDRYRFPNNPNIHIWHVATKAQATKPKDKVLLQVKYSKGSIENNQENEESCYGMVENEPHYISDEKLIPNSIEKDWH